MVTPKPKRETYAVGGAVLGSRSRFMKAPAVFHGDTERTDYGKKSPGGELARTKGDKSEKPIRPKVK
jgi:hypothetical protein